jgi:YegS/Rv2252/BmrU family lipid kinase
MPHALLIFNPNAGRFPPQEAANQTAGVLRRLGWQVEVCATRDADHVTDLAAQAAADGRDALIVAGGDGSISRGVRGLLGSRTALAVIPTGTANVFAKELGLPMIGPAGPDAAVENAKAIAASRVMEVDVGLCGEKPFLLWAGFGLDAQVVRRAESRRSRIKKLFVLPEYFLRTMTAAAHWPGAEIEVCGLRGDGETRVAYKGRMQLAVASNIRYYAGGYALLSPDACIDDGEMDLWIFKGRGARAALRHARNLLNGSHVHDSETVRLPFRKIVIESDRAAALHRDGEPGLDTNRLEITVRPRELRILAPPTWTGRH